MKKFIYCLNIVLLLLIPTIILVSGKDNTMKHKSDTARDTKMIKTTVLLDRSSKKQEEEEAKRQEEELSKQREAEEIAKLEAIEEKKREAAAKKVVPVKVQEVVSSRASAGSTSTTNDTELTQPSTVTVVSNSDKRVFEGAKFYDRKISSYGTDCCKVNSYTEEDKLTNWANLGLGLTASGYQLQYKNIYFNAGSYGNVRIVAADHAGQLDFPLTTIVRITERMNDGSYDSFNAIVLDRGDKNIGLDSKYIFDLVSENQEAARRFGIHTEIDVEVLKLGNSEMLSSVRRFGHL